MDLYNLEAEKNLLACILLNDGSEITEEIMTALKPLDFYSQQHQEIFSATQSIYMGGKTADIALVINLLQQNGAVERAGGLEYLISVTDRYTQGSNYVHWLKIVDNLSKLRTLMRYGEYVIKQSASGKQSSELIAEFEDCLTKIGNRNQGKELRPIKEPVKVEIERMERAAKSEYNPFGIKTGFYYFDKSLWGLQKGNMIVLAARPGVGKTAWALNVLHHAAIIEKKKCLFFSIEMSETEIVRRMFCIAGGIENRNILSGETMKENPSKVYDVGERIGIDNLTIDDSTAITVPDMILKAKKFKRKYKGIDLIVIDYLQKITPAKSTGNRVNEVGEIARSIKNMARQLDVPVLVLCQLNRQIDKGKDGKPQQPELSDLRESGEIEQEADIVAFLRTDSPRDAEVKNIELQLAKFRNGHLRSFWFKYTGNMFKFEEENHPEKEEPKKDKKYAKAELVPVDGDGLGF